MEDERLVNVLEGISNSLRYALFKFSSMAEGKGGYRDLMWKPLLSYQVYRNVKGSKMKKEVLNVLFDRVSKYKSKITIPLSNYIYRKRRRG